MIDWHSNLEKDLEWRLGELASLKLGLNKNIQQVFQVQLRSLWSMLYAHYEGFCLYALSVYLEEIERGKHIRNSFNEGLIITSLEGDLRKLKKDFSAQNAYKFFRNHLNNLLSQPLVFEREKDNEFKIRGKSNLWPKVLLETCEGFCLDVPEIQKYKIELNVLVDRRNQIAHGKKAIISNFQDYIPYEKASIEVMYGLAIAVIDGIDRRPFLK